MSGHISRRGVFVMGAAALLGASAGKALASLGARRTPNANGAAEVGLPLATGPGDCPTVVCAYDEFGRPTSVTNFSDERRARVVFD